MTLFRILVPNWMSHLVPIGVLLVAWGGLPLLAQAQSPPLEARNLDPTAQPGDTVVVQITIGSEATPVPEVNGVGFQLAFDNSALSFIDRKVGRLFQPNHPSNTLEVGPTLHGSAVDYSNTLYLVTPPSDVTDAEVVRLRFEVKAGASEGTTDLTLSDANRSTSTNPSITMGTLIHDAVTVSTTRRADQASVVPDSVSDGTDELRFGSNGELALDYSSLNAETEVTATRIVEPLGGTALPDGEHRALVRYWMLSQSGASNFAVDACFKLSDLMVSVPDEGTLTVYKRATSSDPWTEQTVELRPTTSTPTKICAPDVGSFSQFTVAAPEGHTRTVAGTDGTGNDTGWRSLALPTSAPRISLEDDFDFTVDSGVLLQTYDGSGYVGVTDPTTGLERGEGFMLYVFDDGVDTVPGEGRTLDLPASSEAQSTPVTVDSLGVNDRFHFLGNPYDTEFSLSALAGGDLAAKGFQQTVQVWDPIPQPGQFDVITQGVSDDTIAAWQSFFVQRSSLGSGQTTLTFDPAGRGEEAGDLQTLVRAAASAPPSSSAPVRLRLEVTAQSEIVARDGATVLFDERAEAGWDGLEATQLAPPKATTYATLSSPLVRNGTLVRRAQASEPFPASSGPVTRPLSVQSVGTAGTATLRWPASERGALPGEWSVRLVDTAVDSTVNLRNSAYTFALEEGDGTIATPDDARFTLQVASSAIPVELAGLEAQHTGDAVRLTWQTASETNNAGFQVQRRGAAGAWATIGRVDGAGTTDRPQTYRFTDESVPYTADSLTYRLRQVDIDGSAHISRTATVQLATPERLTLQAPFPNPAGPRATLRFAIPAPMRVQVAIYDLLGRRVARPVQNRLDAGRHVAPLSTSALAPGVYFVRLQAGEQTRTQKLTVLR